jgi:hypothetical protein
MRRPSRATDEPVRRWVPRIVLSLLTLARAGAAAPGAGSTPGPNVELSWVRGDGADTCDSGQKLEAKVARRLGRNPFSSHGALVLEGTVARTGSGWTARIYARQDGQVTVRELTSRADDCGPIGEATILAIALVIDPEAALPPLESAPERAADSIPQPTVFDQTTAREVRPPDTAASVSTQTRGRMEAGPVVGLNILPSSTLGARVMGTAEVNRWLSLGVAGLFLSEARNPDFGFGLTAGGVVGCVRSTPRRFGASGCANLSGGAIYAVPYTLAPAQPGARFWLSSSLSVSGQLYMTRAMYLALGVDGLLTPVRPRFLIEGTGQTIYNVPLLGALAHADLGVAFR